MGIVTTATFAVRNFDKCKNGETARGAVAACQTLNLADSIAGSTASIFSKAAKNIGNTLAKADGAVETLCTKMGGDSSTLDSLMKTTGANTKVGAIAQKAVNPLLCVSAGIRVMKDEDQYAALIEETAAMGAMFGCESLMKFARSAATNQAQATTGLAGKVANTLSKSDKIKNLADKASSWYTKLGTTSNGNIKQTLVKIGLDALFVVGSICAYNAGKKLGKKLSHRDDNEKINPQNLTNTVQKDNAKVLQNQLKTT